MLKTNIFKYFDTNDPGEQVKTPSQEQTPAAEDKSKTVSTAADQTAEQVVQNQTPVEPEDLKDPMSEKEVSTLLDDPNADVEKYLDLIKRGKKPTAELIKKTPVAETELQDKDIMKEVKTSSEKPADKSGDDKTKQLSKKEQENVLVKVDKAYIDSQPPDVQKIIESIKDQQLTEKALRNYINAQKKIIELSSPANAPTQSDELDTTKIDVPEAKQEEIQNEINSRVEKALRSKYPELPSLSDKEAMKEFRRNLNALDPDDLEQFKNDLNNETKGTEKAVKTYYFMSENWEGLAANTVKNEVQNFREFLKKRNITEKDLGVDLNLVDNNKNEYLSNNVIFDQTGNVNKKVIRWMNNEFPVIIPNSVYYSLIENFQPKVEEIIAERARKQGYEQRLKDDTPPNLGLGSDTSGELKHKINEDEFSDEESLESIEKKLEKIKRGVFSNS